MPRGLGRIEKGFDFLGHHFCREPLRVAKVTVQKHVERYVRLYEQKKAKKATLKEMALVLGQSLRVGSDGVVQDYIRH